jgi:hypothetical protein
MQQAQLVTDVRNAATGVLQLVEQAQAKAAAVVQEYTKLGGATFLTGYEWESCDVTEAQIGDAVYALQQMADVLGGNAVSLYRVK